MHSPLPDNWIDALFARLTGLYGNRFTNMWANIDANLVRKTWASELGGLKPAAIKYALDHLPDEFPPSALQFKKVCLMRPDDSPVITYDAPASPEVRNAVVAGMAQHVAGDMKAWARRLKARHEDGDKLNPNQIRCYQNALRVSA
jgi:hypothetical protein